MIYSAILVCVMSIVTILLRALPFLVFAKDKKTPAFIVYLGKVLPQAVTGMLVVYCLRNIQPALPSSWIPELVSILFVFVLQAWKHNALLSILGGTILYMMLVQVFF